MNDVMKVMKSLISTCRKSGCTLTPDQQMVLTGALAVWLNAQEATVGRHPLEAYAESYETMARQARVNNEPTVVNMNAVATDIRQNMIPVTIAKPGWHLE